MHPLAGPEDARRMVRYWAEEGVTWFKAYTQISRADLGAAIDEAHKHGVKVTAHLCSVGFREAVALGIDQLEHGLLTNTRVLPAASSPTSVPPSATRPCTARSTSTAPDVQQHHSGDGGAPRRDDVDARRVRALVAEPRAGRSSGCSMRCIPTRAQSVAQFYESGKTANDAVASRARSRKRCEFERAFVKAGGLLGAGSDPCCLSAIAGYGDQRNYELLIEAGFTPEQAIQIMTSNGAKILGFDKWVGTVSAGHAGGSRRCSPAIRCERSATSEMWRRCSARASASTRRSCASRSRDRWDCDDSSTRWRCQCSALAVRCARPSGATAGHRVACGTHARCEKWYGDQQPCRDRGGESDPRRGRERRRAAGAKVIDLGNMLLLPGLIDSHTHLLQNYSPGIGGDDPNMLLTVATMSPARRALLGAAMGREDLEAGITTVRDVGNSGYNGDVALRDAIAAGWVTGPRMLVSTRALSAAGGQFGGLAAEAQSLLAQEYVVISGVEEARRAVRQAFYDGADLIKVIVNTGPRVVSLDEMKVDRRGGASRGETRRGACNRRPCRRASRPKRE